MIARRIKVTGCLNCPYHKEKVNIVSSDGGLDEVSHLCEHPGFEFSPSIDNQYIDNLHKGLEGYMVQYMPDWCPLEVMQDSFPIAGCCGKEV